MAARGREVAGVLAWHAVAAARAAGLGLRGRRARREAVARHARLACEALGGTFVKLGQLASVRPDVVPPEVAFELERLQDRLPAVPTDAIRAVLEAQLGAPPERVFATFDPHPLATASIAQVHAATLAADYRPVVGATLPAGTRVAVKVVRPGIERTLADDLAIARRWVRRLERLPAIARWRPAALLEEFEASLRRELDLRREGRFADRLAHDLRDDPCVVVPRVVWRHTTRRVLTTEFVAGWPLTELDAARAAGIDTHRLARHGAEVFLRQVLELGRFHADLHPANLRVTHDGRIGYLDFGIVGRTTPPQRRAIAQVLVAAASGDADRALRYSRALGLAVPGDREPAVRRGVDAVMRAHLIGRHPADLRGFALGFLRVLADQRIALPEGYGALIKALVTVEGVARALHPDIDLVATAGPYAARQVVAQLGADPAWWTERVPAAARAALRTLLA